MSGDPAARHAVAACGEVRPIARSAQAILRDQFAEDFDPVEVGASLREARVAVRRNLADVAHDLRIRQVYIEAIEEGRLEDLPGLAYQTGFLRAYGNYLGLDGAALADRLRTARDTSAERGELQVFSPVDEGHLPTRSVLLLAALLAIAVYGVWYFLANTEGDPADRVAALPDRLAGLLEGNPEGDSEVAASVAVGDAAPAPQPSPRGADDSGSAGSTGTIATVTQPAAPIPEPAATPGPPSTLATLPPEPDDATAPGARTTEPPPAAPDDPTAEAVASPLHPPATPLADRQRDAGSAPVAEAAAAAAPGLVLRAITDSWIEIRAGDAPPVYSGLLREGESLAVPEQPGLKMATGNAGGLEILVDGREMPRLGPPGEVMRDIDLDELRRRESG